MKSQSIAVLMTCFNRRETTLACLQALFQQSVHFDVFLVDDGSTDGTQSAVKAAFPEVKILVGTGNLYWVGGMRLAFAAALKQDYDYYLWLNDDTLLYADAIATLLKLHQSLVTRGITDTILVGTTQDAVTGEATYGGARRSPKWYSNKYEFIPPTSELQECDTMYGNCVLIPRSVAQKVGNLDASFTHNLGDLDYGLRARKLGCSIWIAPGYLGTCSQNSVTGSWVDPQLSFREKLKKVTHVKAFPPQEWTTFIQRHSGGLWFIYWFHPYLRALIGYKDLSASPTFREDQS